MRDVIRLLRRHQVPLLATGLAFLLCLFLSPLSDRFPYALFIAAVLVSALHGGMKPGLLGTALSAVFLLAFHGLTKTEPDPDFLPRWGLVILAGLLASYLSRECKRAVEAVTWLHDTLSLLGDAVLLTDATGRVTYLNPAAQHLTGWTRGVALDQPFAAIFRIVHEQSRQPVDDPVAQVLRTGSLAERVQHALLVNNQGVEKPIDFRAAPLRDNRGQLAGVFLVFRDISDRWQTDQDLKHREEQFRALAGCSPTPVMLMDVEGRCTYTNPSGLAAADLSLEEIRGEGWVRAVHPEDREWLLIDWVGSMRKARAFTGEFRFQNRQGEVHWYQLRSAPMHSDHGRTIGHVTTLEDIALLKQDEHRRCEDKSLVRALLDAHTQPVFVKDIHGRYLAVNAAGARFIGKPAEDVLGKEDSSLLPPDRARHMREGDRQTIISGKAQNGESVESTDAGQRSFSYSRFPFRDDEGAVIGLVSSWQDLTDRKQVDNDLRDAKETLRLAKQELESKAEERTAELSKTINLLKGQLSEHQRTEKDLRDQQERVRKELHQLQFLKALVENAPAGILACDNEGKVTISNSASRHQLGLSDQAPPHDLWVRTNLPLPNSPVKMDRDKIPLFRVLRNQDRCEQEITVALGGKEERTLTTVALRLFDAQGNRLGAVMVMHDSTSHRHIHQKLREELDNHRQAREKLRFQISEHQEARDLLRDDLARHHRERENHQQELEKHLRIREHLQGQLADHLAGWERFQGELADHKQFREKLQGQLAESKMGREFLERELTENRLAQEHLHHQLSDYRNSWEQLQREFDSTRVALEELKHEKEFWERLIHDCADGICAFDGQARITVWNPAMERLFGLNHEKTQGQPLNAFSFLTETAGDGPLIPKHGPFAFSFNGTDHVIEGRDSSLQGETGEVLGGMVIFRDVTSLHQGEKEKAQVAREQTAREIAEKGRDQAVFMVEATKVLASSLVDQTILDNLARVAVPFLSDWCAVHSLAKDGSIQQLTGATADITKAYRAWEAGRSTPQRLAASDIAAQVIHTSQTVRYPARYLAGDSIPSHRSAVTGQETAYGFCVPLVVEGQTVGAVSFEFLDYGRGHDPNDLVMAEELVQRAGQALEHARLYHEACANRERLRRQFEQINAIAASLGVGVCALDRAGRVLFLNRAAQRILGWAEAELLNRNLQDCLYFPKGDGIGILPPNALLADDILAGVSVRHENLAFRHKDGQVFPVACTISPLVENGQVEGVTIAFERLPDGMVYPEGLVANNSLDLLAHADSFVSASIASGPPQKTGEEWIAFN